MEMQETITVAEAAAMLGVSYMKLWRAIKRGQIKAEATQGILDTRPSYRVKKSDIQRLIDAQFAQQARAS